MKIKDQSVPAHLPFKQVVDLIRSELTPFFQNPYIHREHLHNIEPIACLIDSELISLINRLNDFLNLATHDASSVASARLVLDVLESSLQDMSYDDSNTIAFTALNISINFYEALYCYCNNDILQAMVSFKRTADTCKKFIVSGDPSLQACLYYYRARSAAMLGGIFRNEWYKNSHNLEMLESAITLYTDALQNAQKIDYWLMIHELLPILAKLHCSSKKVMSRNIKIATNYLNQLRRLEFGLPSSGALLITEGEAAFVKGKTQIGTENLQSCCFVTVQCQGEEHDNLSLVFHKNTRTEIWSIHKLLNQLPQNCDWHVSIYGAHLVPSNYQHNTRSNDNLYHVLTAFRTRANVVLKYVAFLKMPFPKAMIYDPSTGMVFPGNPVSDRSDLAIAQVRSHLCTKIKDGSIEYVPFHIAYDERVASPPTLIPYTLTLTDVMHIAHRSYQGSYTAKIAHLLKKEPPINTLLHKFFAYAINRECYNQTAIVIKTIKLKIEEGISGIMHLADPTFYHNFESPLRFLFGRFKRSHIELRVGQDHNTHNNDIYCFLAHHYAKINHGIIVPNVEGLTQLKEPNKIETSTGSCSNDKDNQSKKWVEKACLVTSSETVAHTVS